MFEKRNALGRNVESDTAQPADQPSCSAASATYSSSSQAAVIGARINVAGDITGEEDLSIEGRVKGTINLPGQAVSVGQAGTVNANITASKVFIDGRVQGDIVGVEQVVLTANGWVRGNITAPRVKLEDGAKFKGSIDMDPSDAASQNASAQQTKPAHASKPEAGKKPAAQANAAVTASAGGAKTAKRSVS